MKSSNILLLLPAIMMAGTDARPASLVERFAVPPAEARILKMVHNLPDAPADQDSLMQMLRAQGFGGMVVNVSSTEYLESDAKWAAFVRGVEEAKKAGMALWLYDERGYPSGNAGGITMRDHPEWEARGWLVAEADSTGGPVALELPPGTLVRASAFPVSDGTLDLDKAVDLAAQVRDGKLAWDAPAGAWHVMIFTEDRLYEGTHAALSLCDKLPYVNLLMPEPTARFIEVTHGAYAKHLGNDLGKYFVATFTDEPSLMSLFLRPQPWRVLPWAPALAGEFRTRRGYALDPWLPALAADIGPRTASVRYDFWLTVAELVSENFFGQIQTWCGQHNTLSGGHLLMEESILTHVPLYGDFFRCARRLDAPGIDCLTSIPEEVPWRIARLLSSVADLDGKAVTMSETSDHCQVYRPEGDKRPVRNVTEEEIRGTCNRLILNGITCITSYYSFAGLSNEQLVRLNEWIGRCCTMLFGGHQVTDIAVLYPVETIWPKFAPGRHTTEDVPTAAHKVEATYGAASNNLYDDGRDFTYVDARTLAEAEVQDGVLRHGALRWRVVVLPCTDTLPMKAWNNLAQFWRTGGIVAALAALPTNSEKDFPAPEVQALAKEMFKDGTSGRIVANKAGGAAVFLSESSEALLPLYLDTLLERDVVSQPRSPIRATHRRIDEHDVFLLINDSRQPWQGQVSLSANGTGEQWNPADGQSAAVASAEKIDLNLPPFGGMLFRFKEARLPKRPPAQEGLLPSLKSSRLPIVQPNLSKGEFVQAELTSSSGDQPTWRAAATLAKGKVDTFLFLSFDYSTPVDLARATCLAFNVSIPDGQRALTSLLVVLRDKNGIEYFGRAGGMMNAPGHARCLSACSQFQRAGWSITPPGELDFAAITTISIGWGGYYGAEGEKVEFTTTAPEAGSF